MTEVPYVIDGHNDLPWALRELCGYDLGQVDLVGGDARVRTDLPRLRAGGVGAQFWSVFVPASLAYGEALTATLEQVDFVRRLVTAYPDQFTLATTAGDIESAVAAGRIASLMGMEGGHSINGSLGALRMLHELGVRYLTLTHNANVGWADSATDRPDARGLTDFGNSVVSELNRIGMFVDLSHVSAETMGAALSSSAAPVIFSHSSARSLCDNPRNVPDRVLARLADNGGVCMVAFVPMFVSQPVADWYAECLAAVEAHRGDRRDLDLVGAEVARRVCDDPPPPCTVSDVADHVDHVRTVAGVGQVGLGGDYDGASLYPDGMGDVSSYPLLLAELRSRHWSESELAALAHGNLLRAMRDMEQVAAASTPPGT